MNLEFIGIMFILIGLIIIFGTTILTKNNNNYPTKSRKSMENFAILIPARYESKVIEDLLKSIKNQTKKINLEDVYIIIESMEDETVNIAKKYNATIFLRKNLNLKSKGYALNELIEDLEKKKKYYDAYFIIDADNVLDKNFLLEMDKTYQKGYDIATGYRNIKNGNDSVIATCSGITFSFLNTKTNERKSQQSKNITLSGTGLYIVGDLIKKWKSFPFHSLTEDYELTLYSVEHNLTSYYNKNAIFYDEQPTKYKNTINQRIRWIKGYFSNRKYYIPRLKKKIKNNPNYGSIINEISGMKPYILIIIGAVLYIINQIIIIIKVHDFTNPLIHACINKIILLIIFSFIIFAILTAVVVLKDKEKINLNNKMKVKAILFSPLFFVTYIPCAIKALLKKEVNWEKVEHNKRWQE